MAVNSGKDKDDHFRFNSSASWPNLHLTLFNSYLIRPTLKRGLRVSSGRKKIRLGMSKHSNLTLGQSSKCWMMDGWWDLRSETWDLRPETCQLTPDTWHLTYFTRHLTPDTWHLTTDTWHLKPDTWHRTPELGVEVERRGKVELWKY